MLEFVFYKLKYKYILMIVPNNAIFQLHLCIAMYASKGCPK